MPTYKLIIEYDGTAYAGWQTQPDQLTIQDALETTISTITCTPTPVIAAGRTDAGVHAIGQVVSFRTAKTFPTHVWTRGLNGLLPHDIAVTQADQVADTFHARYDAIGKTYEYRILRTDRRPALDWFRVWHMPRPLDIAAMEEAARCLIGTHNFASFQQSRTDTNNPVCAVTELRIAHTHPLLTIRVSADRFLKHMVRAIVGTLVEIGLGKRAPSALRDILHAQDRRRAGRTAPGRGLYLLRVSYPPASPAPAQERDTAP